MFSDLLEEAGQERADDAVLTRELRMNIEDFMGIFSIVGEYQVGRSPKINTIQITEG